MSLLSDPGTSPAAIRAGVGTTHVACSHLILGAGCAGLSLAWHLLDRGVREPIVILDRRRAFTNDRTWCYWDVEPTPFDDLATHAWDRWSIADFAHRVDPAPSAYHYRRLRSIDFYQRVLDRLDAAENVTIALGEPVLDRDETARGLRVSTPSLSVSARWAYDSTPRPPASRSADLHLLQHFLGRTIRTRRACFDPSRPILMDFRTHQADGPHFVYVLPLSDTEALVENTYLFPASVSLERHRHEIARYLRDFFGLASDEYEVLDEESGRIPLTSAWFPARRGPRTLAIGLSGGAARSSSGYAFARIQRQTRAIADQVAAGTIAEPPPAIQNAKYRFFDTVFLQVLRDRPGDAARIFSRLFAGSETDALVRFLCEASTPADDLRIVAALPKLPFMRAAVRSARLWSRRN